MAVFKGKKYRSEFTNGFANGSFITMTDDEWITEIIVIAVKTPNFTTKNGSLKWVQSSLVHLPAIYNTAV
jgi:hypothetical protein